MGVWENKLNSPSPGPLYVNDNSVYDYLMRSQGCILTQVVTITGTGSVTANIFKVTGSVRVYDQWAIITEVTTLANMTDVYADIWDGTVATDLTKSPGATLSGAPVGTLFTKDKLASDTYSVSLANQARFLETSNKAAVPFTVTQKNGVDTFIRFNFTTTDSPISFKMQVWFEYYPLNSGILEFV